MEEEYNWELILKVSLPISAAVGYAFYANINNFWKWFALIIGIVLAGSFVYMKDKKKSNVFTACAFVFLAALMVRLLKGFGII